MPPRLLAVQSADIPPINGRNPAAIMEREIKRVKHGRYILIPASSETHGCVSQVLEAISGGAAEALGHGAHGAGPRRYDFKTGRHTLG